jgi:energy-coupling factor transport system ATP-binding protein
VASLVRVENLYLTYNPGQEGAIPALQGVSFDLAEGEHLAVVGRNGSGKSTLAKCLNALLTPTDGDVWAVGHNTRDRSSWIEIRSCIGMVFQNPDNQFVTTSIQEEIAFGPENLGVPRPELRRRVEAALDAVALDAPRDRDPRYLSAGQKAKLAIASALAMAPRCLILDEATAMLDPVARQQVMDTVCALQDQGMALINVTHFMEEAALADRVLVLDHGHVAALDAPAPLFTRAELCQAAGLQLPMPTRIAQGLASRGMALPGDILHVDGLVEACVRYGERAR